MDIGCTDADGDDIEIIEEDDLEEEAEAALEKESLEIVGSGIQDEEEFKKCSKQIRAKLLQFSENERPPYWGTWTKTSLKVSGRKPFCKDKHYFDYDYDSGDDWEEEEQGESLSDEEKDKEEDEEQDDEDDDGFFVGHGVLDKEEMNREDSEEQDEVEFDEELEHKKQRLRAQEFEEQYKKKRPVKLKHKVWCTLEKTGVWNSLRATVEDSYAFCFSKPDG